MRRHDPGASIALMEIIIAIFFFSICAAICMNFFASSRIIADKSSSLNTAVVKATNVAEIYKAAGGDRAKCNAILKKNTEGKLICGEDNLEIRYSEMTLKIKFLKDYGSIKVMASGKLKERDLYKSSKGEIFSMDVHV